MQKRVYFHREEAGAPHFTCLVKLTVDDPRTLAELAALTAQQYTMRFGAQHQLASKGCVLRLDSAKGTKLSSKANAATTLAAGADVFVCTPAPKASSSAAAPATQPSRNEAAKVATAPAGHPPSAPVPQAPASASATSAAAGVTAIHAALDSATSAVQQRNLKHACSIYEEVLRLCPDEPQCMLGLAEIHLSNNQFERAASVLRTAVKKHPGVARFHKLLGDALTGTRQFSAALDAYNTAGGLCLQTSLVPGDPTDAKAVQLACAVCLRKKGERAAAGQLVMTLLNADQTDFDVLLEYAIQVLDLERPKDAISVLVRLIVQQPNHKLVKRTLAESLQTPLGLECLYEELSTAASVASALAFLASSIKEYGAVEEAIRLYQRTLKLEPTTGSYALNLMHSLEVGYRINEALDVVIDFCSAVDAGEGVGFARESLQQAAATLRGVPAYNPTAAGCLRADPMNRALSREDDGSAAAVADVNPLWGSKVGVVPNPDVRETPGDTSYSADQLDVLALLCTAVKVLYVSGALARAAALAAVVEPLRRASKTPLHETLVRNEVAYFGCARQLMEENPVEWCAEATRRAPLYLAGDSHCLTAAWRTVTLRGERRQLVPLLSTGLKAWHLRDESVFYPKVQFWNSLAKVPAGAQLVMMFGEIDCREGMLVSVNRNRYEDLASAIRTTVDIYVGVLRKLALERGYEVFVHPVPPVLNETRAVVKAFNTQLHKSVLAASAACKGRLHWLDFFDRLLSANQSSLRSDLVLDGTHMSPLYVVDLDRALAALP